MDERNFERVVVERQIECRTRRGVKRAILYNLSVDGCMIEVEAGSVAREEEIFVALGNLIRARGRVVWQSGLNAGVQFSERLHEAVVRYLGFKPSRERFDEIQPRDRFGQPLDRRTTGRTRLSSHLAGFQPRY